LRPGDVIVALLEGARITKVRPAVVVSTELYHREGPDLIVGILTTQIPEPLRATDHLLVN
jgi:mRNA interferase MazF